ncbi:hypothetical protein OG21DRAFT_1517959 [Imleria badia]|nr:hypothetical protein OG21DRAFT_1517959 [Imleria badia]
MTAWTTLFSAVLFWGFVYSILTARQFSASCGLSEARLQVPANQTQLTAPTSSPSFIAIGLGTQNYTCNATTSTYVLTGAVAELFDSSCLYGTPAFDTAPGLAYTAWEASTDLATPQDVITSLGLIPDPLVLGQHMYVPSPTGSGLSPKWDFTSSGGTAGNLDAYVIGVKAGDLPSSNPAVNIDNLMIKAIKGDLASLIFRVQNNGGQAPAGCGTQGANITVKYTAQYWFFGGNVKQNNI